MGGSSDGTCPQYQPMKSVYSVAGKVGRGEEPLPVNWDIRLMERQGSVPDSKLGKEPAEKIGIPVSLA